MHQISNPLNRRMNFFYMPRVFEGLAGCRTERIEPIYAVRASLRGDKTQCVEGDRERSAADKRLVRSPVVQSHASEVGPMCLAGRISGGATGKVN